MTDWWSLLYNSLWTLGLAIGLAVLGQASYRAYADNARLRSALGAPGFQRAVNAGLVLFCLGLAFSAAAWWETGLWSMLAVLFSVLALQRNPVLTRRVALPPSVHSVGGKDSSVEPEPGLLLFRALASIEIWPVALLVAAAVISARLLPWALGLAAAFWLVRLLAYGHLSLRTPADWGILLLLLMVPVTLWVTPVPETTRTQVFRLLSGVALYYAIVNWSTTTRRLRLLAFGTWLAGLGLASYALVSVQWATDKLPFIPGFLYEHLPSLTSDAVNPNVMAGSLVLVLPCALACLLFGWQSLGRLDRILAGTSGLAVSGVLVGTQARGALLALLAVLALLVVLRWRRGWLLMLALAAASAIVVWSLGVHVALEPLIASGTLGSLEGRLEVWSRAVYMIRDFPFTGVGMGSFGQIADIFYPFFLFPPGAITHAHNLFLQVATDLGIPGLIAWLSVLLVVISTAWRVYRDGSLRRDGWMAGLGAGLLSSQVALAVHGMTDATTWGQIRTAPVVWALWGLTMASMQKHSEPGVPGSKGALSDEPQLPSPSRPTGGRAVPPASPIERGNRRWLGWGLVVAGFLVLAGWSTITGVQFWVHARSLQSHLHQVEQAAQAGSAGMGLDDLKAVGQHLAGMHQDLEAIQSRVGPLLPAGRALGWIPRCGGDLAAASDLLKIAVDVSAAGDQTFQALAPALDLVTISEQGARSTLSVGERLLPVLVAAQPQLRAARQNLAMAREAQSHLAIAGLSPRVVQLLERLDRYLPWFETALDGAVLAPGLLGANGPRTYLVLAQNNQELRPTGGFISGVGEIEVEGGRLSSPKFSDSYAVDNLQVPHDLTPPDFQRTLLGQLWFFRDTNWDPDFPTSAQRAMDVYARDRGVQTDGVIALDLTALQLLVDAVGPLQVEGISEPVTGETVLPIIQEQWSEPSTESGQDWWLHRKDFMGQIAATVMDRLTTGQDLQPVRLAQALKQALDEKHILIYVRDPGAAGLLRQRNWDGAVALPPAASDALLVVDSNVGFNKADVNVSRSIQYEVDLAASGGPRARLTLTYQNRTDHPVGDCVQEARYGGSYADMTQRCYWDYVRVYVPVGSRLLKGPELSLPPGSLLAQSGDALPSKLISPTLSMDNWAVWTAFFALEPLAERSLTFEYQLPAQILDSGAGGLSYYRLQIQKQPGTDAVPLRLEIVLPPDAQVVKALPDGLTVLDTDLSLDRDLVLGFQQGKEEP
jgi:O-antigen ligase